MYSLNNHINQECSNKIYKKWHTQKQISRYKELWRNVRIKSIKSGTHKNKSLDIRNYDVTLRLENVESQKEWVISL